nr:hypothetical protein [Tanacetum cinerariifolium]
SSENETESWGNDEDDSNNDQDSGSDGSDQEKDKSDQEENEEKIKVDEKEEEEEEETVKTLSNDFDDEDKSKTADKVEVDADKGFVQEEGTDAAMTNNAKVLVNLSSHSSDLAAKFLKFYDIPHIDGEVVSPMDVYIHHEVPSHLNINNLTQEKLLGPVFRLFKGTRSNYTELEYNFEECYKALSEKLDWENLKGGDYPFDLTKPLPFVMSRNRQKVPVDYFFNNDLKYLQGGISTMTYMNSLTKTKALNMILQALKTWFQIYRFRLNPPMIYMHYKVEVMRKHRYRYLKGIVVRRADNILYRFNEGNFLRLRFNDIEDMLLLVVHNQLINLLGDDISNFTIDLRMFTKSLIIQKRVEDLQLGVKSYQKKINVTRPQTTISGIRKKDPYTPYQDPQRLFYVNDSGRNRFMRSDEIYKFSDGTLTRLRTSLGDITKKI